MIQDDLRERLKLLEPALATIDDFWGSSHIEANLTRIEQETLVEDFWKNPRQGEILKELQHLKDLRDTYITVKRSQAELFELLELFGEDESTLNGIREEIGRHEKRVNRFKIALLMSGADDTKSCFLSINAGAGGTESQDWSEILLRMYVRFCEREGLTASIVDYQGGEGAGIKSATLFIKGNHAYGLLRGEQGIHRLVRISPFDANKRRHTSFSGVFVLPEHPDVDIAIEAKDLRIDTYRAGGAGGQHVNKTESAVRITHLPTGIVVQCQNERSQIQNKETAMKMLAARLAQKQKEEQQAAVASIEKKKIEWGSQIRSYVLHPYKMVKDHRTEYESFQPEDVLDGDLMAFIERYLVWAAKPD